jgi:membrane protease YdiL (CAAX protease family)
LSRERDRSHPTDAFGLPEGLLAAIVCALLLVGTFAAVSAYTPMPPAEYWGALTTFALLALGVTLPGCAALYDALGRAVRRDWRALAALAALIPALYVAYALAVREVNLLGILAASFFAAVPALAFGVARGSRTPTALDGVALGYLLLSLWLALVPPLTLPQQGGLVGFFQLAVVPLLLLLLAWRGWPGLGYTWHLSGRELRDALLAGLAGAAVMALYGFLSATFTMQAYDAGRLITVAVSAYFFTALPAELLLRGGFQNGISRALRDRMGDTAPWVALVAAAALSALAGFLRAGLPGLIGGAVVGAAAGWTYQRTGKVTASAVAHFLIVWLATTLGGVA